MNLAIDFDAVRVALVHAVGLATGLPSSQIIMAQAEGQLSARPKAPYVTVMVTSPSIQQGRDWMRPLTDAPERPTGQFAIEGNRTMMVGFDSYATTHEGAYGVMATLQAALDMPPVGDVLASAGLAHYSSATVADVSALLNTAYEGRAHLDSEFGLVSSLTLDVGRIDSADVGGIVTTDNGTVTVNLTGI